MGFGVKSEGISGRTRFGGLHRTASNLGSFAKQVWALHMPEQHCSDFVQAERTDLQFGWILIKFSEHFPLKQLFVQQSAFFSHFLNGGVQFGEGNLSASASGSAYGAATHRAKNAEKTTD